MPDNLTRLLDRYGVTTTDRGDAPPVGSERPDAAHIEYLLMEMRAATSWLSPSDRAWMDDAIRALTDLAALAAPSVAPPQPDTMGYLRSQAERLTVVSLLIRSDYGSTPDTAVADQLDQIQHNMMQILAAAPSQSQPAAQEPEPRCANDLCRKPRSRHFGLEEYCHELSLSLERGSRWCAPDDVISPEEQAFYAQSRRAAAPSQSQPAEPVCKCGRSPNHEGSCLGQPAALQEPEPREGCTITIRVKDNVSGEVSMSVEQTLPSLDPIRRELEAAFRSVHAAGRAAAPEGDAEPQAVRINGVPATPLAAPNVMGEVVDYLESLAARAPEGVSEERDTDLIRGAIAEVLSEELEGITADSLAELSAEAAFRAHRALTLRASSPSPAERAAFFAEYNAGIAEVRTAPASPVWDEKEYERMRDMVVIRTHETHNGGSVEALAAAERALDAYVLAHVRTAAAPSTALARDLNEASLLPPEDTPERRATFERARQIGERFRAEVPRCGDCDEPGKCAIMGCGWAAVVKHFGWTLDQLSRGGAAPGGEPTS